MPLTPGQQALCALVFGTSLGVGGTVAVQKKVSPKPPVSAAAKGERVGRPPSAPAVGRVENRTEPAPRILDAPLCTPMPSIGAADVPKIASVAEEFVKSGLIAAGSVGQTFVDALTPRPLPGGGVTPGIPDAPTWAMMISGFGLVGLACRRRKAAS